MKIPPKKGAATFQRLSLYALCCGILCKQIPALIILPPSSRRDYRQLSSLLANTFDAPTILSSTTTNDPRQSSLQSKIDFLKWNVIEKSLTEEFTFKQYTSTARRMRGKKYCLLVAKECSRDTDDNYLSVEDDVVGMVEMGMCPCPVPLDQTEFHAGNNASNNNIGLRPQPTVGVLCVKSTHRNRGIGQALLCKCEQVASEVWSENFIFVDVEPNNRRALLFFETCDFDGLEGESGGVQTRDATVVRRRSAERRPHYLLCKRLKKSKDQTSSHV